MSDVAGHDRLAVFISYAGRDRAWAEWVAWHLRDAGHDVEIDIWHWGAGDNFVRKMSDALGRANVVVALYSAAYFQPERFTTDEWTAVLAARGRLVPLRLEDVTPPGVLRPLSYRDLFGLSEEHARRRLLRAVAGPRRPADPPAFPGAAGARVPPPAGSGAPRLPGVLPTVWNVPDRSAAFIGRDELLVALRERLCAGGPVVAQALHGMGGVGKTTLAVEYAHRFAGSYTIVWWVDAERSGLIADQLAALAVTAGWVPPETAAPTAVDEVRRRLRMTAGWLVVFDNAEDPDALTGARLQGPGHVVVTSRNPGWAQVGEPVEVDVFTPSESVALLHRMAPAMPEPDAERIAAAVGDLPLAVAQAAGVVAEGGMSADDYLAELAAHTRDVLSDGKPAGYPLPLAGAVRVAAERLAAENEAAAQILRLCALLAPEPVPVEVFTAAPTGVLPAELAAVARSTYALRRTLGRLARYGLAKVGEPGPQLHRLTQAVVADLLDPAERDAVRAQVHRLLAAAAPNDDGGNPQTWPRWAALLPHLLAANPTETDHGRFRRTALRATWYRLARGDTHAGHDLAVTLYEAWRERLGPNDRFVLSAAHNLATAHRDLGQYTQAHALDEDVLTRRRKVLGDEHTNTLASANQLAVDLRLLGRVEEAHALDEDTLRRYRRVRGDDDAYTLTSANNLALDLRRLKRYAEACTLNEDTLARRRKVLGDDHPYTLTSASNLARDLYALGRVEEARTLDEDTLTRRRRVLGKDHPNTLISANNLAADLHRLGRYEEAYALNQETLERRRRVLGDGHPDTRSSVRNMAASLRRLGRGEEARRLIENADREGAARPDPP